MFIGEFMTYIYGLFYPYKTYDIIEILNTQSTASFQNDKKDNLPCCFLYAAGFYQQCKCAATPKELNTMGR